MYNRNRKRAQSFVEYSLLIAVGVSALIIMQYYFGRSVQGLLGMNVDNLGGEKMTEKQYSPGKWYGATSTTRITTSGFDYEGRHGFQVSTGTMQRSQVSKMTGAATASELAARNAPYNKSLIDGEDVALVKNVEGSEVDPGIAKIEATVNNNAGTWNSDSGQPAAREDEPATSVDSLAVSAVDNYVNQGSVTESLGVAGEQDSNLAKGLNTIAEAERNLQAQE